MSNLNTFFVILTLVFIFFNKKQITF